MRLNLFFCKIKFEPTRQADFLSRARALRGAPLGSRAFYILPVFAFVADHCETILRHFLLIFADTAHKMAARREKWRLACMFAVPVYAFEGFHISLIHGVDQQIHLSFGIGNQAAYKADDNSTVVQT